MNSLRDIAPPPPSQYSGRAWFIYNTGIPATSTPGLAQQSSFQVDKDSDFFWTKLVVHCNSGNDGTQYGTELLPEVNVLITNTSSGRAYMNEAVPLANFAGQGRLPFILPMETYIPAMTQIQVAYSNVSDNSTYTLLELSFIGYKAFL